MSFSLKVSLLSSYRSKDVFRDENYQEGSNRWRKLWITFLDNGPPDP